ncbi:diguanylate cyclase [Nitrosophilus alvini]|uniref:diguanylate cyclase n=1 Tax=Nitrosophilus alvini TaxID=2714855 RepID=UPI001909E2AB|nr:diguanylate cyclase [Nitrosophilus alvini]
MNMKTKLLVLNGIIIAVLLLSVLIVLAINFRTFSIDNAREKSKLIANIVKDGLTAHMVNNIMDKRDFFLSQIKNLQSVEELRVIRSRNVIKQFGEGFGSEKPTNDLEKEVLETGKSKDEVYEGKEGVKLRVVIPYTATAYATPNCLKCHDAEEGEVLGAISMKFDIAQTRMEGIVTIIRIIVIAVFVAFISFLIFNYLANSYLKLFESLKTGLKKAYEGDYSHRIHTDLKDETAEIAKWTNTLYEKIEHTLEEIKKNVSIFINFPITSKDPLIQVKNLVNELADIYRFKKIIEKDKDKEQIYERIVELLKERFKIKYFAFYECNSSQNFRKLIYITKPESFCKSADDDIESCRACRVNDIVRSEELVHICESFDGDEDIMYLCLPYRIDDDISILISFSSKNREEYDRIKSLIPQISNFLDAAKPVLKSKILLGRLKELSLKDGLTGAYNRRYLDEFAKKAIPQAKRSGISYGILMIDIDYFKMVNDTYGHDAGDIVIKELVNTIEENIRDSDVIVRFGGEEFMVLLYNTDKNGAFTVAEKIRNSFKKKKIDVGPEKIEKSVSIGISIFPEDTDSLWKAIKYADLALYRAKEEGRNRVVEYEKETFPEMEEY